jgi:hypothetical protein
MKIDRYTKVILTIIAAALVLIAGQNLFEMKTARAANGIVKVAICNPYGDGWCADVLSSSGQKGLSVIRP